MQRTPLRIKVPRAIRVECGGGDDADERGVDELHEARDGKAPRPGYLELRERGAGARGSNVRDIMAGAGHET